MQLADLLKDLDLITQQGNLELEVSGVAYDSREVVPGGLFVAVPGFSTDGHEFIQDAVARGAAVILAEREVTVEGPVTVLRVKDSRKALARVSANYYHRPTEQLNLIGVTGTNGKTSITYFVRSIFEQVKKSTGIIGTIGTLIDHEVVQNKNTTPESYKLQGIFNNMLEAGVENCVMEVSSHALALKRVAYCDFNMGIFTNLTPDHLELHHSMEAYFQAKAELFKMTSAYNIINGDDPYGQRLIQGADQHRAKTVTYGVKQPADFYATDICYQPDATTYLAHTPGGTIEIIVNLPGDIFVYNSLAALACAYLNGISLEDIRAGIRKVKTIRGRLEVVYRDYEYNVVIDFAHTEDALEKALTTLRSFAKGRIILVFGVYAAPGEKGAQKRQAMGRVAAKHADVAIVTSDNPKEQDPEQIINEIVVAMEAEKGNYVAIVDRKEAIQYAVGISKKDDIILMAGKGHETSQVIGKEDVPFNETEIVTEIIKRSKNKRIG